jgi:hypothetical protein
LFASIFFYFLAMESVSERLPQILGPRATTGLAVLAGYLLLIRKIRHLRRDRKHAEFPYKTREDFSKMTGEDAWAIVKYCMSLEFPFMSEKALSFALFKYGSLVRTTLSRRQMLTLTQDLRHSVHLETLVSNPTVSEARLLFQTLCRYRRAYRRISGSFADISTCEFSDSADELSAW